MYIVTYIVYVCISKLLNIVVIFSILFFRQHANFDMSRGNAKKPSLSSVGGVQSKMEQPNSNNHTCMYLCMYVSGSTIL